MKGDAVKEVVTATRTRMQKTVEDVIRELSTVRTGRASLHMFDQVMVDYYGTQTPINQVATIHVPEASLVTIQPWDPSQIGSLEKAILSSDLGLNPSNDGKIVRVPIPPLTEDRRQQLAKHVRKVIEEHRTAIRNIRRDSNELLKKLSLDGVVSKDDEHRGYDAVQKATDDFVKKAETLGQQKEAEILEV